MMLSPYRVLDLTNGPCALGPMILADLGAEVVRIDQPGQPDDPILEHVYNRNKQRLALDLTSANGKTAVLDLARGADFVFESAGPGVMDSMGLGYRAMRAANPEVVYVATSAFGQDGPYAKHAHSDITLAAMGGMMALNGEGDRRPLRISVPQTWLHAAAESAAAALVAHFRRLRTGESQFVDVAVQTSVFWTGLNAMIAHAIQGKDIERAGTLLQLGVIDLPLVQDAKDGQVVVVPTGATMAGLLEQMIADGVVDESWREEDWNTYDLRFLTGQATKYSVDEAVAAIGRFTARRTKADLFAWGLAHGVTLAPVTTTKDVLEFDHLEQRGYWQPSVLPSGERVNVPGRFVRAAKTPIAIKPATKLDAVPAWPQRPSPGVRQRGTLPFEGLKVADFSWIGVGPITAKYFADHGATTVRVEAGHPVDRLRGAGPHKDGIQGVNRSQFFASFNTSKLGMSLNLKHPQGQAIARRLLQWCDVAFESFTPGTMRDLGLGYETAKDLNPGIIMVSTCLMGQTGPAANLAGYGYHAAAISGFYEITGWPDRAPAGPFNAYTDVIAPHFLSATVMGALDHRQRTGEGQYIEQAQMESALHFLAPELVRTQLDGTTPCRVGNDSPLFAPHNAYRCAGNDEWIAIAVETDEQWRALRRALGEPRWAMTPELEFTAGRLARRAEVDASIEAFTGGRDRYELMAELQGAGVPAGVVQRSHDLLQDPQLAYRKFFRPMEHPEMGEVPYEGHMFAIRGYESGPRFPAPCLGEHNVQVLTEVLGMSDDELAEAMSSGALG